MASPSSPEVIDVDVDEPPRITGGSGKPDAPFEIASSDSEDESPAKRAKPSRTRSSTGCGRFYPRASGTNTGPSGASWASTSACGS